MNYSFKNKLTWFFDFKGSIYLEMQGANKQIDNYLFDHLAFDEKKSNGKIIITYVEKLI